MAGSARQQILEQTLVELQDKIKSFEDKQQRLLNNINEAITELVDKAAKQRGVRGQDLLSLHQFFATHLASAIEQLETVLDDKLKHIPLQFNTLQLTTDTSGPVGTITTTPE